MKEFGSDCLTKRRFLPDRWHGETGCLVGPFDSREGATRFVHRVIEAGNIETATDCIFVHDDTFFIEVLNREAVTE